MDEERSSPSWVYLDEKPVTDDQYFENLTRCVFQAGLSWELVAKKWPEFRKAFDGFDVDKVSEYGVEDLRRLMKNEGIIRNRQKIQDTMNNSVRFRSIREKYGGFRQWLDGIDKGNNYYLVVKLLKSEFSRVGTGTAHIFLWSVGEPIKYDPSVHDRRPRKIM